MLKISERRKKDGYHLLHSLFSYIDLADIITISANRGHGSNLYIKGPYASSFNNYDPEEINKNLISKVLRLFAEKFNISPSFDIVLTKNIPLKSGLGGGSSNAARIADFLNKYYNLKLNNSEMVSLVTPLGADIPFFLQNSMAFCEGVGDKISPKPLLALNNLPIVIVLPNFSLPTPQVYKAFNYPLGLKNEALQKQMRIAKEKLMTYTQEDLFKFFATYSNDLEKASFGIFFEIKELVDTMKIYSGVKYASMSGSGSACFAICQDDLSAQALYSSLRNRFRGYKIFISNILCKVEHENISSSAQPCYYRENFMEEKGNLMFLQQEQEITV